MGAEIGHRAARLATALALLCVIGALAHFSTSDDLAQRNIKSATSTAGIIIVVAQTPFIGGLPKSFIENLFGTFIGASTGILVFFIWDRLVPFEYVVDYYLRLLTTPVVGAVGLFLGYSFSMEGAGKLVPMTYLLVIVNNVDENLAVLYAVSRFIGILVGICCLQLSTVIVFQRSATEEIVSMLGIALEELTECNRHVWSSRNLSLSDQPHVIPDVETETESHLGRSLSYAHDLTYNAIQLQSPTHVELDEERLEQYQGKVHITLNAALGALGLTSSEVLVSGRNPSTWFFVPAHFGCNCGWHVDKQQISKVIISLRRVARMEYNLWIMFSHMPTDNQDTDEGVAKFEKMVSVVRDLRFLVQTTLDGLISSNRRGQIANPDSLRYLLQRVSSIQSMSFGKGHNGSHSSVSVQDLLSIQPSLVAANKQAVGSNKGGSRHSLANYVITSPASAGGPAGLAPISSADEAGLDEPLIRPPPQGFSTSGFVTTVLSLSEIASMTRVSSDLLQHAKWRIMTTEVWWHNFQFLMVKFSDDLCALHNDFSILTSSLFSASSATLSNREV